MESGSAAEPGGTAKSHDEASKSPYDAVIFDMDGVVTDTAIVHAAAWKALFDEVLQNEVLQNEELHDGSHPQAPFDEALDYERFVDGRPREDGIRTFLASRGIQPDPDEISRLAARPRCR